MSGLMTCDKNTSQPYHQILWKSLSDMAPTPEVIMGDYDAPLLRKGYL